MLRVYHGTLTYRLNNVGLLQGERYEALRYCKAVVPRTNVQSVLFPGWLLTPKSAR